MSNLTPEQFVDHFLLQYHKFLAGELITEVFGYKEQMAVIKTTRQSTTAIQLFFLAAAKQLDNRINEMDNITQEEKDKITRCYHSAVTDMFTTQLHEIFNVLDAMHEKQSLASIRPRRTRQPKPMETEGIFKNLDFEMPPYNPDDLI